MDGWLMEGWNEKETIFFLSHPEFRIKISSLITIIGP